MTREQCIEAIARVLDPDAFEIPADGLTEEGARWLQELRDASIEEATAAYDAVVPALRQAEREAMRDKCVRLMENRAFTERNSLDGNYNTAHFFDQSADALRALDIGGQDG